MCIKLTQDFSSNMKTLICCIRDPLFILGIFNQNKVSASCADLLLWQMTRDGHLWDCCVPSTDRKADYRFVSFTAWASEMGTENMENGQKEQGCCLIQSAVLQEGSRSMADWGRKSYFVKCKTTRTTSPINGNFWPICLASGCSLLFYWTSYHLAYMMTVLP